MQDLSSISMVQKLTQRARRLTFTLDHWPSTILFKPFIGLQDIIGLLLIGMLNSYSRLASPYP